MEQCSASYVTGQHISFKHAKGPSDLQGKEFHVHHEIIWFMGGQAHFISDRIHTPLEPNSLVLIPCESYHQLLITGSQEDYHRCVFHFLHVPNVQSLIQKTMVMPAVLRMNSCLEELFHRMIGVAVNPSGVQEQEAVMHGVLTLVLHEITQLQPVTISTCQENTIVGKCLRYINSDITQPLSLDTIAEALHVSESYLSHAFRKQMQISLHQYILKKRTFSLWTVKVNS